MGKSISKIIELQNKHNIYDKPTKIIKNYLTSSLGKY
jgi:hypothetical protein